jgi:hypothetical protein
VTALACSFFLASKGDPFNEKMELPWNSQENSENWLSLE